MTPQPPTTPKLEPIQVPATHDDKGTLLKTEPVVGASPAPPPEPNPALEVGRVSKFPDVDPVKARVALEAMVAAGKNMPKTEVLGRDTAYAVLAEHERPINQVHHDRAERAAKILGHTAFATVEEVCANAGTDPRFDELVSILAESWAGGEVPPSLKK